ncbi:RagB/SusD family nutrient uptake outer membrane protein (plasmid) [Hymenobacter sp. NBH84]|uniref:RagB/SusD family nutrient uptake outer membrane protein n=1 Tax=Hymenobacter citatus TaxID=2763506 RepID=A0ABR7MMT8_9BACT|nr:MULTISPECIES: RagB/SusD family nutrient uptake outer membrane protein [Hymenobacter]MBC6612394.1 RagB/SusD family nutrient uptake outer membrane protein [Hymenobacter citatus]QNE41981.1 RagB/SusD family nutrient uptake outer membrane protein [Hymenobacter sp. NBH84]
MKLLKTSVLACSLLAFSVSCNDKSFLNVDPTGALSDDQLNTVGNIDKQVIAAYAQLGNDIYYVPYTSMWPYGNVRGGDAYKGGGGTADVDAFHFYETFIFNRVDLSNTDEFWYRMYLSISRCNDALRRLNAVDAATMPNKAVRQGEMRFLRGHFYFLLKEMFKYVPYIDEELPVDQYPTVSNVALSNDALWSKVAEDFRFAVENLPATQPEIGRATKPAAQAYLAKTLLYQAYTQNESNAVTGIDAAKLTEVNALCNAVISSGQYSLHADFATNFLTAGDNGVESVFAIQFSRNDGTPKGRTDRGNELNYPMNPEYGCCSFHQPSQNLINSFKTDAGGLPRFADFNTSGDLTTPADFLSTTVDPRLDHTVAIVGHPFKYDPNFVFQESWVRVPQVYGYNLSMKESVLPTDPSFQKTPPFMSSSKNWTIIRYADVLLWKAEALIELNRPSEALPLINQIRQRAQNSTARLKQANGAATSKYNIGLYPTAGFTQAYAREALRFERRLEFAMEGYRFFDLVRWGIAAPYLNTYFAKEKNLRQYLSTARFTPARDEYMPIPINQINFSKGLYKQNVGW